MLEVYYYFKDITYLFSRFIHSWVVDKSKLCQFFVFIPQLISADQIQFYIKLKILLLLNQIYKPILALFCNNKILYMILINLFSTIITNFLLFILSFF